MRRRGAIALLALLPACSALQNPRPGPVRAMEPRPNPPVRAVTRETPQRQAWMTRFWEELSPAQRRTVLSRLRRGLSPRAKTETEAAAVWDVMGLPERETLVTGRPAATATNTEGPVAVR